MSLFKPNDIFAGRYELKEPAGKGEFSEVWKALDQMADGAVVSLKIFASDKETADEAVRKCKRRFSVSQQLSHPHLLKVSYYDISEGLPYLVMPFCPGGSLAGLIRKEGLLSERKIALILSQAGSALDALHHQEPPLLHGNVKPSNILVSQEEYFLLTDFSFSHEPKASFAGSPQKSVSPSAAYAPPESFDEFRQTDAAGDIFSLGVTLYEIATKTLPWAGKGGQVLLKGEKVPALPAHYSAELNELLQACMSSNKNKRPNAKELHLKGKQFLETGRWKMTKNGVKERKPIKKQIPYLLAAAIFLLLILGAFWAVHNQHLFVSTAGVPEESVSGLGEREQEVDAMLIAALEDQLEEMTVRTLELEEENRLLKQNGAPGKILANPLAMEENKEPAPPKRQSGVTKTKEPKNVVSHSASSSMEEKKPPAHGDLEKQLNKISDPAISGKARDAWRREVLAQFSEGPVRILDETDGTPKRFSTRIFINLLYRVPHTVVVKEVKRDQNQKVSELRLEMQPNG